MYYVSDFRGAVLRPFYLSEIHLLISGQMDKVQ